MIYNDRGTIWVECDVCKFTLFGGFTGSNKSDVTSPLIKHGWTFQDKVLCPECSQQQNDVEVW